MLTIYHIMSLAICTTQVKQKRVKMRLKEKKKGYEKFTSRGFKPILEDPHAGAVSRAGRKGATTD